MLLEEAEKERRGSQAQGYELSKNMSAECKPQGKPCPEGLTSPSHLSCTRFGDVGVVITFVFQLRLSLQSHKAGRAVRPPSETRGCLGKGEDAGEAGA